MQITQNIFKMKLRILAALAKDLGLALSTHMWLITISNCILEDPIPSLASSGTMNALWCTVIHAGKAPIHIK